MITVEQATMQYFDGIKELLHDNHVSTLSEEEKRNGFVTTNLTDIQLENLIVREKGIVVATDNHKVIGFAMAASWTFWSEWPLFAYMIELLPQYAMDGTTFSAENTYQYGPVCVEKSYRGQGIFERLFYASLRSMQERYPYMVTFINHVNPRSYAAHTKKVRTSDMGVFHFNSNQYHLMACPTNMKEE